MELVVGMCSTAIMSELKIDAFCLCAIILFHLFEYAH
jgi:hypothetical protein